jgi:hypothetical protein
MNCASVPAASICAISSIDGEPSPRKHNRLADADRADFSSLGRALARIGSWNHGCRTETRQPRFSGVPTAHTCSQASRSADEVLLLRLEAEVRWMIRKIGDDDHQGRVRRFRTKALEKRAIEGRDG